MPRKPALANLRICPGCGTVNPRSVSEKYFDCWQCSYEIDYAKQPLTLGELAQSEEGAMDQVNLPAYVRAILEAAK